MIARLRAIAELNVDKVRTFDVDAASVSLEDIGQCVDLVLIDGEHTDRAVVSDFQNCRRFCKSTAVIAFHDYSCVRNGIREIMRIVRGENIGFAGVRLGGDVFALIPEPFMSCLTPYLQLHAKRRRLWWLRESIRSLIPKPVIWAIQAASRKTGRRKQHLK